MTRLFRCPATGFLALCLVLAWCESVAQANFQRLIGSPGSDRGHSVINVSGGGYIVAGHTNGFGAGNHDILLIRLSAQGDVLWQKTYGGTDRDDGGSINLIETPDNGFVVGGTTSSFSGEPRNLYVFKTDANGNLLWDYRYDSGNPSFPNGDHARGVINCSDGNILLIGTDDSHTYGANDGLVMKINQNGSLLWKRLYSKDSPTHTNHLISARELPGGNFLVFGESMAHGPGSRAAYLLKIRTDGGLVWARTYGGNGEDAFRGGDLTTDHCIVITGFTSSFGAGQTDAFLSKLDTSGNLIWTKTYGGTRMERGASVRTLPDGTGYLLLGYTESFGSGGRDVLVIRTDISGDVLWSKTFGAGGTDAVDLNAATGLELTPDGGFILTGWSVGLSGNGEDILILKSDLSGSVLCEDTPVIMEAPAMQTIVTQTLTAEAGNYAQVNSTVGDAGFILTELCHCIPDSVCNSCVMPEIDIEFAGNIDCKTDSVLVSLSGTPGSTDLMHSWYDSAFALVGHGITYTVAHAGWYYIVSTDTVTQCENIDSFRIADLRAELEVDAGENGQIDCRQETVQLVPVFDNPQFIEFLWSGPAGGLVSDPASEIAVAASGGTYSLLVTDTSSGCTGMDSVFVGDVRVFPVANAGADPELNCSGDTVILDGSASSAGPDFSYAWSGAGALISNDVVTQAYSPGWYVLEVTHILSGCTAADSAEVTALQELQADLTILGPECPEDTSGQILVAAVSGGTPPYSFSTDGVTFQSSPDFTDLPPGIYTVWIADNEGCLVQLPAEIPQPAMIEIYAGPDTVLQIGQLLLLTPEISSSFPFDSVVWSPGDILSCTRCTNPSFHADFSDSFQLEVTVYAGGCIATDALLIFVPEVFELFVPNVFSPNNDGINDFVIVFSNDVDALVLELEIFDRWGELIFRNTGFPVNQPAKGWDGTFRGKPMNPGVFVCVAKVLLSNQSIEVVSTDVTLIR